jgi:N-acetylneuraminic acid mutarotase
VKKVLFFLIAFVFSYSAFKAQSWAQLPDFPGLQRDDGVAFIINNKAYCGTGLREWALTGDFYSLDLTTETWITVASMPLGKERQYACGFTDGTNGFVFGGEFGGTDLNDLWMYSPATNSWTAKTSKPGNGVRGASCFVIGNVAYIIGGAFTTTDAINEVWAYDMVANTWSQKNNLPFTNWRGSGASANSKGYLVFGMNVNQAFNRYLYEYDPGSDNWTYKSTFSGGYGKNYATMQAINDDLFVFSGKDSLNTYNNDLWVYNLISNSWFNVNTFPNTARKGGMGFTNGGILYYTCGITQANLRLKETWKVSVAIGIKEFEKEGLGFFPNPANDMIYLKLPGSLLKDFRITDLAGQISLAGTIGNANEIDVSSLSPGIYFLVIGSRSSKLLIQ